MITINPPGSEGVITTPDGRMLLSAEPGTPQFYRQMLVITQASGRPMAPALVKAFKKLSVLLEVRTYMEEILDYWPELDIKGRNAVFCLARELVEWERDGLSDL